MVMECLEFFKLCPICSEKLSYSNQGNLNLSISKNTACRSCSAKIYFKTHKSYNFVDIPTTQKCKECNNSYLFKTKHYAIVASKKSWLCRSCRQKGDRNHRKGVFLKRPEHSKAMRGENNPMHGKVHPNKGKSGIWKLTEEQRQKCSEAKRGKRPSEKTRMKMRESHVKRAVAVGAFGGVNQTCCNFLDKINLDLNINILHNNNNKFGEFVFRGYRADGYDINNNIWFEWDETRHKFPAQRDKDIKRQEEIITYLDCIFIRYSEFYNLFLIFNNKDRLSPKIKDYFDSFQISV
jgi:hypothetical protein